MRKSRNNNLLGDTNIKHRVMKLSHYKTLCCITTNSQNNNKNTMRYKSAKANNINQKDKRRSLRNNATPVEAELWRVLKGRQVGGYKFRRQQGIGPYILDFYCPELLLCVELDGGSHDFKYEYDEQRSAYLKEQGICVIRFSNDQIWTSVEGIVSEILRVANQIEQNQQEKNQL